ncbi:MAG: hypothetical protein JF607_17475 [Burkholderiales bacterium]|jgi:hypothetical protein|nr:hypothetical protein [Burkholderiales bacterium]
MSLQNLHRLVKEGEAELERLHGERSKLLPGDRDGASRIRTFITGAANDLEDLKRQVNELEKVEHSAERAAERAAGRAAAQRAQVLQSNLVKQWAEWQRLIEQAVAASRELHATIRATAEEAGQAVKHHHGRDHAGLRNQGFALIPSASATTGGVTQAVAAQVVALIDALPVGLGVAPEYLLINRGALPSGAEPQPVLLDRVARAFNGFNTRAADLCTEPQIEEVAPCCKT